MVPLLRLVHDDIEAVTSVCRRMGAISKVIIETALLTDEEKVKAAVLVRTGDADFIKTSTGFASGGATVADVALLRRVVGPDMGVKAAGGVRLRTETHYVRAAPGGTGSAKCAGNYGGALLAQREARAAGFDEVLWLDARERRWLEEAGGMNLMLVRKGKLSTPPLSDTILAGITRDSLLELARAEGLGAEERAISTDPADWTDVSEAFTSGTAAGTAHIREIVHEGRVLFARPEPGPVARKLGERLERIKLGLAPDPFGWRYAL